MKSTLPLNQNELETSATDDASIEEVCENFCESDDSNQDDFDDEDDDSDFDDEEDSDSFSLTERYKEMGMEWPN